MKKILLLFLLSGCHQITDYPQQPSVIREALTDTAMVTRVRVKNVAELDKVCQNRRRTSYGCAADRKWIPTSDGYVGFCTIYVIEPLDFNDVVKLALQGHEVEHCFGREHG